MEGHLNFVKTNLNSIFVQIKDSNEILKNYPKSVKSTQVFWYKPKISRDEGNKE